MSLDYVILSINKFRLGHISITMFWLGHIKYK